ncbi:MAG: hypothetical protein ACR2OZ_10390 [Verrucomicrobiales bacterium]
MGISAFGGSVTNCRAANNEGSGISATQGSVTNCTARFNGNDGISANAGVVAFCSASGNDANNGNGSNIAAGATRTGNNPSP